MRTSRSAPAVGLAGRPDDRLQFAREGGGIRDAAVHSVVARTRCKCSCLWRDRVDRSSLLADLRLGLYRSPSNRLRYHAIPVAVSRLYHDWPRDYTASRNLAMQFQNHRRGMVDLIRESVDPPYPIGTGIYFWVADDRGLADFVAASFGLFGPRLHSLSKFYFVLLAASVLIFFTGYWRRPAVLLLPVALLRGWLVLVEVMRLPNGVSYRSWAWGTELCLGVEDCAALRVADVRRPELRLRDAPDDADCRVARAAHGVDHRRAAGGVTGLPVSLAVVDRLAVPGAVDRGGTGAAWWVGCRLCSAERPQWCTLIQTSFAAALLVLSIAGLRAYQRETYHPEYFTERGQRTFWHNALMGLAYHPTLKDELPMAMCDDKDAIDLVLARMFQKDPTLDPNVWNWAAALNSLGSHNEFDWVRYEANARDIYFDLWRDAPAQMLGCLRRAEPFVILKQITFALRLIFVRLVLGERAGTDPGRCDTSRWNGPALPARARKRRATGIDSRRDTRWPHSCRSASSPASRSTRPSRRSRVFFSVGFLSPSSRPSAWPGE